MKGRTDAGRHAGEHAVRPTDRMPGWAFVVVAVVCSALQALLARRVFLFWDDYYFLGQARSASLDWDYLSSTLFTHFSPVTRLANWIVAGHIAAHPWVIPVAQGVMLTAVVCSATWLMVALFDRTVVALGASVLLGVSLTLVPLGSWWTAGANILPGMAGFLVAFASAVLVIRGRSRWWAVPAFAGALIGVLDYETPMLLPGYLLLWVVLFGSRVTDDGPVALVRRTWWLWLGIITITGAAAVNFRLNYYSPQPRGPLGELLHALVHSWVNTLVPTALGLHDPGTPWLDVLAAVLGWVVTVLVVGWLVVTRQGVWRGLAFAALGWLLPTLALLLNRLGRYGFEVADDAIYVYLPTVLTLIGLAEAFLRPRRRPAARRVEAAVLTRWALPTALVSLVAAYVWSVEPTASYRIPPGATGDFVANARASADATREQVGRFSVIDSLTHAKVMPEGYGRYSRDSNVLGLTVPGLRFDDPRPPYFRFDDQGRLRAAPIEELARTRDAPTTDDGKLQIDDADDLTYDAERGNCFTATDATTVTWRFQQVSGDDLVVRTRVTVDAESQMVLFVDPGTDGQLTYPYPIDSGDTTLLASGAGSLEIVDASTLGGVQLNGFTPGVGVCLQSIDIGQVQSAAGP